MAIFSSLSSKFKGIAKPAEIVYPIIIIIAIPVLLAINTVWNLRSFNRDANFALRHQAVSIADTLKPFVTQGLGDEGQLVSYLNAATNANSDIVSITLLRSSNQEAQVVASTLNSEDASLESQQVLNQLAVALDQPFAGLTYDPNLEKEVWNVVVPIETSEPDPYLLTLKLKTDTVNDILKRTSRDSFVVLFILIIVTLILLANHFIFYRKAQEARQLAELDKLKDEFISMASHELRAPVTALAGYLDLLQSKITKLGLADLKPEVDTLNTITNDLRTLINDLLEVSRIEQDRLKIEYSDVQLDEVITKVIETMKPLVDQKNLKIIYTPAKIPAIKTDKNRVKQVLTNLLNNSVKYTIDGEVQILVTDKGKFIEVTVKDTGIGIPASELVKLFTKFHRVKDKKTEEVRGSGLGLWITKQIVENLGGKIYAESIYGTGTSITFTIPIAT